MSNVSHVLALTLLCVEASVRVACAPTCSAGTSGATATVDGTILSQLRTRLTRTQANKAVLHSVASSVNVTGLGRSIKEKRSAIAKKKENGGSSAQHYAQRTESSFLGCDPGAVFRESIDEDKTVEGSANGAQYSECNRTKRILDDFQALVNIQRGDCQWEVEPKRVLSFGCSIGIECEEAKARFPGAEIYGYDIEPRVITQAWSRADPALGIKFTASIQDLPKHGFDLILVNNVLFSSMPLDDFRQIRDELFGLLSTDHGVLELMIYDEDLMTHNLLQEGYGFNSSVAWEGIREVLPHAISMMPHRTCFSATYPSWKSTLFIYRHG